MLGGVTYQRGQIILLRPHMWISPWFQRRAKLNNRGCVASRRSDRLAKVKKTICRRFVNLQQIVVIILVSFLSIW